MYLSVIFFASSSCARRVFITGVLTEDHLLKETMNISSPPANTSLVENTTTPSSIGISNSPSSISNYSEPFPEENTTNFSPSSIIATPSSIVPIFDSPSPFRQFESINHTTSVEGLQIKEIHFFFAYVALTTLALIVVLIFARKTLYKFFFDTRKYVDVAAGDSGGNAKYGKFSSGESKIEKWAELEEFDGLEHKSREVGEANSV